MSANKEVVGVDEQSQLETKPSFKRRALGYTATASLVGAIAAGGYVGYEAVGGSVSSNHQGHKEAIQGLGQCRDVVESLDFDEDGVARVRLRDLNSSDLASCGFGDIWDETTEQLGDRDNLLDGWVVTYDLDGELQLPSIGALDQAIEYEEQESRDYAIDRRSYGVIIGGFGGFTLALVGTYIAGAIYYRKSIVEPTPRPYDWASPEDQS